MADQGLKYLQRVQSDNIIEPIYKSFIEQVKLLNDSVDHFDEMKRQNTSSTWEEQEIESLLWEANKIFDMFEKLEQIQKEKLVVRRESRKLDLCHHLRPKIENLETKIIEFHINRRKHCIKPSVEVSQSYAPQAHQFEASGEKMPEDLIHSMMEYLESVGLDDKDIISPEFQSFNKQVSLLDTFQLHLNEMKRQNTGTWEALELEIRKLAGEAYQVCNFFQELVQTPEPGVVGPVTTKFNRIDQLRQKIHDLEENIIKSTINKMGYGIKPFVEESQTSPPPPPQERQSQASGDLIRSIVSKSQSVQLNDEDIQPESRSFNEQVGRLDPSLLHLDEMERHNSGTSEANEVGRLAPSLLHLDEVEPHNSGTSEANVVGRLDPSLLHLDEMERHNNGTSEANEVGRLAPSLLHLDEVEPHNSSTSEANEVGRLAPSLLHLDEVEPHNSGTSEANEVGRLDPSLLHLGEMERHNSGTSEANAVGRLDPSLLHLGEMERHNSGTSEANAVGRLDPSLLHRTSEALEIETGELPREAYKVYEISQKTQQIQIADELAKLRIGEEEEKAFAISDDDMIGPEYRSFSEQLRWLDASLLHLDKMKRHTSDENTWEALEQEVRKLELEADEVRHMFEKMEQTQKKATVVRRMISKFNLIAPLRQKIQDIKEKINKSPITRIEDGIEIFVEGQTSAQARRFEDEEDVAAKLLMEEAEPRRQRFYFLSITGMGGVGKSTLARQIYQRSDVREHFNYCAWVDMSKANTWRDVMCRIIEQVMGREKGKKPFKEEDSQSDLELVICNFVKRKKSLFILDNLSKKEDLDKLKLCFSSQYFMFPLTVLLTTSNEDVAQYADPKARPHKLQPLDKQQSLKLFWKVVLQSTRDTQASPSEVMEYMAKKIVAYSYGLPLAIVKLGRLLLAEEPTVAAFKEVLENVNVHLDSIPWGKIVDEIYRDLPPNLKQVFLYFGLFPEDTDIQSDRLIRLWVAELGINYGDSTSIGDDHRIAEESYRRKCLKELMAKNLIQVAKWKSNGEPESFSLNRFSRNLARSKGKPSNPRRVALCIEDTSQQSSSSSHLYSLLCFTKMSLLSRWGHYKRLRVLDLEDALGIVSLPKEMRKLTNLNYLSLGGPRLTNLPTWVGKLSSLQTLSLHKTGIESLPIEILELTRLRHLLCNSKSWTWVSTDFIFKSAIGISLRVSPRTHIHHLKDLQTLWLHTGDWIKDGLENLTQLKELRLIGREGLLQRFEKALSKALVKLERLEVLHLEELGPGRISLPSFQPKKHLYDITILGVLEKLPHLHDFPPRLTRLRLGFISLTEDMTATLEKLPELKDLTLDWHAYDGVEMKCSAGGFHKLEYLTLNYFDLFWEKCIPGGLSNFDPTVVKCIPSGLRNITALKELTLAMPKEFLERVKSGGEDWVKIEHVCFVNRREVEITKEMSEFLRPKPLASSEETIPDDP